MTRVTLRRPSRRTTRRAVVVSTAGALVLAAALVWQAAYAGFAASTTPIAAGVTTGTVAVGNEIEGLGTVALPALRPGETYTECVAVTSTGSVPAQVRLYVKDRSATATALPSSLTFTWTAGTGGGVNDDCAAFTPTTSTVTSTLASFGTTYAQGVLPWDTTGGATAERRTYRVSFSLSANAPASVKGASATVTFAWEAQQR
ncbi:hypothetical protein [Modestobacter roseus]|uniref:Camelysin-like metallo-endopeptidase n=1 Tax=Modestobacter roseus TaxID=1181884 RepID=A0A562IVP6_9ACTN|nr:hypothetical protein [Modestobacter roseus]MQA33483.1 hypothetical protein [Modestobacter roseus]TWH74926.1 hypothetical protein JD78_03472 [Modestobacter roseus]